MLRARVDGELVVRPYTPTTRPSQRGHFELVVKMYQLGKMSRYVHTLKTGDMVEAKGPVGRITYRRGAFRTVLLVGAGSGITPLLQLVRLAMDDPDDNTRMFLVYQNREERDILLRQELERFTSEHPEQFDLCLVLSRAPENWAGRDPIHFHDGYVDEGLLANVCDEVGSPDTGVYLCGPSGFTDSVVGALRKLGVAADRTFVF